MYKYKQIQVSKIYNKCNTLSRGLLKPISIKKFCIYGMRRSNYGVFTVIVLCGLWSHLKMLKITKYVLVEALFTVKQWVTALQLLSLYFTKH